MKKYLLFLVAAILAIVARAAVGDTFTYQGLKFKVTSDDDHTVAVDGLNNVSGEISIPSFVVYGSSRYFVTEIGGDAFRGCSSLTSVNIPNSVTAIGAAAFEDCSSLASVTIPNSVTQIGYYAFYGCSSLTSVNIPNSVTAIGAAAFEDCSSLASVNIPNSVTEIGGDAFSRCSSLLEIVVENGNPNYISEDGVLFNIDKTGLIQCPGGKTGEYSIPTSVTQIGAAAFEGCSSLTSVNIPNSVIEIGNFAFAGCSSLTSVSIPNLVTEIGGWAFAGCSSLTSVNIPNSVTEIGDYAFIGCSSLTSVSIPNSVTKIGRFTFCRCSSLTSVTIPNSVTEIGANAFRGCSSLLEIVVENGNPNYISEDGVLFNIDKTGLLQCPGGKTGEYSIPTSVTQIGGEAFYGCSSLTSVTIPASVTEIGMYAFSECSGLKTIYDLNPTPQKLGGNVFYNVPTDVVVYIPKGSFKDYFVASGWAYFTDFREMGAFDIALSEQTLDLTAGNTATITATVTKDDDMTVKSEEWSSSNPEVATVDNGVITAVAPGEAVIRFTAVDGYGLSHTESCKVTVSESAGVADVVTDADASVDVYNLQGVAVLRGAASSELGKLPAGLYIVRQGKSVKKIIVK